MYTPNSLWTWSFLLVTLAQALIALGLEGFVFGKFQMSIHPGANNIKYGNNYPRSIPTYLSLLIFAFVYQMILVYDALQAQNTIQIIGLVVMNLGILIYTAIQKDQIAQAFQALNKVELIDPDYWTIVKPYLIALPCIIALGTALLAFVAWKLYDEFAWTIYKQISADLRLKRRYLIYQIYIALLKFDFFLFLGFEVQFLVIVSETSGLESDLTIASIPVTVILLLLAAYFVRKEIVAGMVATILVYFGALAYFLFKLVRMYANSSRRDDYLPARRTLAVFAVITILLLIVTIVVACWCTNNFNKGLKPHVQRGSSNAASSAAYGQQGVSSAGGSSHGGKAQYYMDNIGGQTPYYGQPNRPVAGSRMEID